MVARGWEKYLWKPFILPSRSLFCLRLFMNKIHVHVALAKRGICLVSWCHLCKSAVKDVEHLSLNPKP